MPWKALPYVERGIKVSLVKRYKAQGIPHLVFVNAKTWETITLEGRFAISQESFIEDFPYHPRSCYDISDFMEGLGGKDPCFLVFTDASEAGTEKEVYDVVRAFADSAKVKGETHFFKYFTANDGIGATFRPSFGMSVPPLTKYEAPKMIVVSFQEKKFWTPKEGEEAVTEENIQKLLDNHRAGYLAESKVAPNHSAEDLLKHFG